jgi:glutamine synthetase type III
VDASRNSRAEAARRTLIEQRFEELYHKIGILEKQLELESKTTEIKIEK